MPYIQRNERGRIIKASARTLVGGELVPHNHPEVTEFLRLRGQDPQVVEAALAELRRTDGEMARAVEDVQDRMSFRVKQRVLIQDIYDQATARIID